MKRKAKKAAPQWKPVQLPKQLVDDLETFANSKTAKSMGFTNKSQFAAYAVRAALDNHSDSLWVYEFVDVTENKVTIIDHEVNKVVNIVFIHDRLKCSIHGWNHCEHQEYIRIIPRVEHMLKGWNFHRFRDSTTKEQLEQSKKRLR